MAEVIAAGPRSIVQRRVFLPENVVQRISRKLDDCDVPLSRNNWFLEAAIEQLRRSDAEGSHGKKWSPGIACEGGHIRQAELPERYGGIIADERQASQRAGGR